VSTNYGLVVFTAHLQRCAISSYSSVLAIEGELGKLDFLLGVPVQTAQRETSTTLPRAVRQPPCVANIWEISTAVRFTLSPDMMWEQGRAGRDVYIFGASDFHDDCVVFSPRMAITPGGSRLGRPAEQNVAMRRLTNVGQLTSNCHPIVKYAKDVKGVERISGFP
jgi:hypothetical protein